MTVFKVLPSITSTLVPVVVLSGCKQRMVIA